HRSSRYGDVSATRHPSETRMRKPPDIAMTTATAAIRTQRRSTRRAQRGGGAWEFSAFNSELSTRKFEFSSSGKAAHVFSSEFTVESSQLLMAEYSIERARLDVRAPEHQQHKNDDRNWSRNASARHQRGADQLSGDRHVVRVPQVPIRTRL